MSATRFVAATLAGVVLLGLALWGGACRPAGRPGGETAESPGAGSGTGGPGSDTGSVPTGPGKPGDGLPVVLEAGLLAFGLFTANADDTLSELKLATVDQGGRGLTERFVLSRYDEVLSFSPDRTRLLAYRFDRSTPGFTRGLWVYDLAAGTVTPLDLPPFVEIHLHFSWSPDSRFVTYASLADAGAPGTAADNVYRLVRVPVDGTPGAHVDTVRVETCLPREIAPVPGRDIVVFTGPPDQGIGFNVNLHDFEAGSGRTLFYHANLPQQLAVSPDGRFVAYKTGGPAWVTVADMSTGKTTATEDVPMYGPAGCLQDLAWSPVANILAIVRDDCNDPGYPPRVTVAFYDLARGKITVRTDPIDSVSTMYPFTAWAADGTAFFLAGGAPGGLPVGATTIYRIDPATGEFTAIYTCAADQCIRGLNLLRRD